MRSGGKGTPRRVVKKKPAGGATDDKKLQATLKKLNVQPIAGIEEVNMFKEDGKVLHFSAPKGSLILHDGRTDTILTEQSMLPFQQTPLPSTDAVMTRS